MASGERTRTEFDLPDYPTDVVLGLVWKESDVLRACLSSKALHGCLVAEEDDGDDVADFPEKRFSLDLVTLDDILGKSLGVDILGKGLGVRAMATKDAIVLGLPLDAQEPCETKRAFVSRICDGLGRALGIPVRPGDLACARIS